MIPAINFSITPPGAVDTLPTPTLELAGATFRLLLWLPSHTIHLPLIRPIGTVPVPIAAQLIWYTL